MGGLGLGLGLGEGGGTGCVAPHVGGYGRYTVCILRNFKFSSIFFFFFF